jgi:hypothetical protein
VFLLGLSGMVGAPRLNHDYFLRRVVPRLRQPSDSLSLPRTGLSPRSLHRGLVVVTVAPVNDTKNSTSSFQVIIIIIIRSLIHSFIVQSTVCNLRYCQQCKINKRHPTSYGLVLTGRFLFLRLAVLIADPRD